MDKTEVLEKIEPITRLGVREIEHNPRTKVMVAPEMIVLRPGHGARMIELAPEGAKAMARFAGFPMGLAKALSPDTFSRVATELLASKQRYSLLTDGDRVVDFADPRHYRPINPERVLKTIEHAIKTAEYHRALLFDHSLHLEIVGERREAVARGDIVQAGALVAFSPIGIDQPLVQSFALRLACINGMTSTEVMQEFRFTGGEGDDIWQWFRQSVGRAYRSIGRMATQYRKMRERRIPARDRSLMIEAMLRQSRVSNEVAEGVRARALEEPPQNEYDILNLITWASSHLIEEPQQIRRVQLVAANFASESEHQRICPVCHHTR